MSFDILNVFGNWEQDFAYTVRGVVTGRIDVRAGGDLVLEGLCGGSLIVHNGARAVLLGEVRGDVVNRGGQLHVYGAIGGQLRDFGGSTTVHQGAQLAHGSDQ